MSASDAAQPGSGTTANSALNTRSEAEPSRAAGILREAEPEVPLPGQPATSRRKPSNPLEPTREGIIERHWNGCGECSKDGIACQPPNPALKQKRCDECVSKNRKCDSAIWLDDKAVNRYHILLDVIDDLETIDQRVWGHNPTLLGGPRDKHKSYAFRNDQAPAGHSSAHSEQLSSTERSGSASQPGRGSGCQLQSSAQSPPAHRRLFLEADRFPRMDVQELSAFRDQIVDAFRIYRATHQDLGVFPSIERVNAARFRFMQTVWKYLGAEGQFDQW